MAARDTVPFVEENKAYEAWLATQCAVVTKDLRRKHKLMAKNAFTFLRATYFRWARQIESLCPELKAAPRRLCVGDSHLENFGTWRDAEGRLVWGVNDFDESASMPYPFDLVRLAASARLAPKFRLSGREIALAILDGYWDGLEKPRPILLDEQETWMRPFVACSDEERVEFWQDVDDYPPPTPPLPSPVKDALIKSLPKGSKEVRFCSRVAGAGSLGRPRYVAVARHAGGRVVREAKAIVPSAWLWAHDLPPPPPTLLRMARGPHRAPDPHLAIHAGHVLRRIAADSEKVELGKDGVAFSGDVLRAMGYDLASVHAGSRGGVEALADDLNDRKRGWLRSASRKAAEAVERDFKAWRPHA